MYDNSINGEYSVSTSAKETSLWKLQIIEEGKSIVFDTVGKKEDILELLNKLAEKYDVSADSPSFGEVLYEGDVADFEVEYNDEIHSFFIRISSMYSTYEESDYDRAVNDVNEYLEYNY